jgi:hypothetical protein
LTKLLIMPARAYAGIGLQPTEAAGLNKKRENDGLRLRRNIRA